ncbi:unnamed protein product [Zymoseptoria tritici ST99CH_1A5]|uniref:CBM1 domain-containing protein n=3 Tax=Zymoseptoria tritici TaxID=1047171 RepID=A0A1X7RI84_ZYMT9|nr:unnamed protein product [Zymoseptoria tritici ST99CH_3D7]SMR43065.1 unnamed protein product [Zymoseptoria tritici ST99CH_1E4]SMY20396.1 unnamed protein product [Zymoseptoria tritici ST99CH_1A5]
MKLLNLAFGFSLLAIATAHPSDTLPKRGTQVNPYDCNGSGSSTNCPNSMDFCQGTCGNGNVWYGNCKAPVPPSTKWTCKLVARR